MTAHAHLAALSGHYASLGAAATPGPWHAIEPLAGGDLPRVIEHQALMAELGR